jgi:hypothetical protein
MNRLPDLYFRSLYKEKNAHWRELTERVPVTLRSGHSLVIPKGFKNDGATVPRLFWSVISPHGRHDLAVLVHDYLLINGWNRREADRELRYLLQISGVHPLKTGCMYVAVRGYGICKQGLRFVQKALDLCK